MIAPCPLCGEVFVRTNDASVEWWCPCERWTGVRFHERGALDITPGSSPATPSAPQSDEHVHRAPWTPERP